MLSGSVNVLLRIGYIVTISLCAVTFGNYGAKFVVGTDAPSWHLLHDLIRIGIVLPTLLNFLSADIVSGAVRDERPSIVATAPTPMIATPPTPMIATQ